MRITAGIFLIRRDGKLLIGHPTKDFSGGKWSITKGGLEENETPLQAALRETEEEANIFLKNWQILHNLKPVEYIKGKKVLHGFVMFEDQNEINFDDFDIKCTSMVPNKNWYEMDNFMYATLDEAAGLLHEAQVVCLEEIKLIIENLNKFKSIIENLNKFKSI